jgi:hypothetical protein
LDRWIEAGHVDSVRIDDANVVMVDMGGAISRAIGWWAKRAAGPKRAKK